MLSIIIITKNEELNIENCLKSVEWADEIIVIDSGSTDNTVDIAKKYTNKVIETDWLGYGVQKQRALEQATCDWVLNLDADESVSIELKNEIQDIMKANVVDACRIPIQMYFYGKPLHHSSSPSRHIRLFKRDGASYSDDIVHEKITLPEEMIIKQLSGPIMHYSFQDVSHMLYKMNRYSSYTAKTRIENNKPASLLKSILGSGWMFFRCYILQRGFLDGREGFLLAVFHAHGTFYRGIKQIYQDQAIDRLPQTQHRVSECEQ